MTYDNLNNPFSNCRNPVYGERFVGRYETIRSIKQRVLNPSGGSLAIVGSPRIGKTSLANHVFIDPQDSLIEKKFLSFKINLSAFRNSNHLDLLRELVKQTLETFNNTNSQDERLKSIGKNLRTKDDRWIEFQSKVEKFFKGVKRAGWSVVAVIDEFDNARQIFRDGDGIGFAALRILAENPKKYGINLVTISRLPLHIIAEECSKDVSSFDGIFQTRYLQWLRIDELIKLLDKLKIIGLEVNPELVDFVWKNTGGHPYLASVLADELAQSWLNNHQYNLEEALRNSSSEFRKYYNQSIELLKKDGNLDQMLLQTIFGPVTKETILKAGEMERYCGLIKRHENGHYIAFSSDFEDYLNNLDRSRGLWNFWHETQEKLRKLVDDLMLEKYCSHDWIFQLEKEDVKFKNEVFDKCRNLQIHEGSRLGSSASVHLLDFTNMDDLWQIIDQHWNLFQPILGKNTGYWNLRLQFLSTVRRPMAYNSPNKVFADHELEKAKKYCQEILALFSKSSRPIDPDSETSKSDIVVNINNQVQAMGQSESKGDTYKQSGNFGIGHMSGGNIQGGAKVAAKINEAEQQNIAKAAQEIQQLLEQLSQTYPTQTLTQKR